MRKLRYILVWTLLPVLVGTVPAWAVPAIVHQPPLEAKAGQAVAINATVTDPASPVSAVRLYFRTSGALGYQTQPLYGSGYLYSGQVPKEAVTAAGVDYYLEARNQAGETSTSPLLNAALAPHHLVVREAAGAPVLRLILPADGTELTPEEATVAVIGIEAAPGRPDLNTVAVVFDEKNVTSQCYITDTLITFPLPASLAPGRHSLRVSLRNTDGVEAASPRWSFNVRPAGAPTPVPTAVPAFRWAGGLNAETQYAAMTKDSDLSEFFAQPRGWLNRLNLNFNGQAGSLGFLGSAFLTSEEKPGRQPVDRVRMEVFDPTFNVTLGDQYPVFSPYSLDNLFVRGGGLTLYTGPRDGAHSTFQAVGGLTRIGIEANGDEGSGTYEQWLWAGRWRYDFLPGTGLGLNAVTVNDQRRSVQQPGLTSPAGNFVVSAEAGARVSWSEQARTLFFTEYGLSYYDEEMSLATVSLDLNGSPLPFASALRGGMRWEWGGRSFVKLEYKDTGARYVSLASPWLIGDWRGLEGDAQVFLAGDALVLSATGNMWRDNLTEQKDTSTRTTSTTFLSGNLNYRVASWLPSLSLGYSLNRQQNNTVPVTVDNQTHVLNLGAGVQVPVGADQVLGNLSYSQTLFQDQVSPKVTADTFSSSFLTSLMYLMGPTWTWSAGVGLTGVENRFVGFTSRVDYTLANLRAAWKAVPGRFDLGAGWENLSGRGTDDSVKDSLTTLSASGTYYPTTTQSLTLTLSSIGYDDQVTAARSYGQFVTDLRYTLTF